MYIELFGKKTGFTFVEIIASIVLLAIVAGGVFGAFVGAEKFIVVAKHRMEALNFARKTVETLKGRYAYSDIGPPVPDIGTILQGELANLGSLTYAVEETQPEGYKKITVEVTWNEPQL